MDTKRLELLRRSSLSLGVVVVVGVRERRVKSEGELDQSVQPPAPLVDGRPLLGWRLSPLGVVYRVAFGAFSAPASRWSLLLRALWAGRIEVLLGWSIAPPIDAQHAICTRKKNCRACFLLEIRGKNIWFSFFFSTRITCKFYTGIPNEKSSKKSARRGWMTSRFHVLTLDLSLPSLDFCRQSCVVVFSGGRGAIDLEISRRKKREKSSSRENSQKKGLLISNKKKKKRERRSSRRRRR